jgi:glycosyltransferase involved in cell wall biosynthesis
MKLLVGIENIQPWQESIKISAERPRLALPYAFSTAFVDKGHQLHAIDYSGSLNQRTEIEPFEKIYQKSDLLNAMKNVDMALLWGGRGVSAIIRQILLPHPRRRVLLGSYVWNMTALPTVKSKISGFATRFAACFSQAVAVMTDEQLLAVQQQLSSHTPVIRYTCGIDAGFYRLKATYADVPETYQDTIDKLLAKPYIIMLGDQQRCNQDALELVRRSDINLLRVCRGEKTSTWFSEQVSKAEFKDKMFYLNDVDYVFLRFLIQNAACYAGLVDSSWQPAGWTVACEALASGVPIVLYDGLVSRELKMMGADSSIMRIVPFKDIAGFQSEIELIIAQDRSIINKLSQDFISRKLDMEVTSQQFVRDVENLL